jgi:WD40 repeat protein
VRLWDAVTDVALQTLEGHTCPITAVAFSLDGKQLASASEDGTLWLWDAATGAALMTFEAYTQWVTAVAFSPNTKQLAPASEDRTVRLWHAATGSIMQTLEGHASLHTLIFSIDGLYLQTNRGPIQIHPSVSTNARNQSITITNIFVRGQWICRWEDNFLWLPTNYRSSVTAIHRNHIAIGCQSGRPIIIGFGI